jgi:hypothetical protein
MKKFSEILNEGVPFSKDLFTKVLTSDLNDFINKMLETDDEKNP